MGAPEQLELSLFPPKEPNRGYGLFGYEGAMCDLAIFTDNAAQVEEAVKRGWIVPETETFDGMRLVKMARKYGSENVALCLVGLGWKDEAYSSKPMTEFVWGMDGRARNKSEAEQLYAALGGKK